MATYEKQGKDGNRYHLESEHDVVGMHRVTGWAAWRRDDERNRWVPTPYRADTKRAVIEQMVKAGIL